MKSSEAKVFNMNEQRIKRGRKLRMPATIQLAVDLIKQKEAQALDGALITTDGAKAETLRAVAVGLDMAATLVLQAFDTVSRKPQL